GGLPGPDGFVEVTVDDAVADVHRLLDWAIRDAVELDGFEVRRPSLEDVYLSLTARQQVETDAAGARPDDAPD
ncbi:MAG TPA: hypothetical protein VEJ44_04045, partial [Acidimicrobiales bacterium]|nr:hypothetical protein [Acidimicrobiales bacterium]